MKKVLSFLGRYWMAIAAVLLAVGSVPLFQKAAEKTDALEQEKESLTAQIASVQSSINANAPYAAMRGELDAETEKINASRQALYERLPTALLEEDQIRYISYLEGIFGSELTFAFAREVPVAQLSDGNYIGGMMYTLNFETSYEGFKTLVNALATDSHIAAVNVATLNYDPQSDVATGAVSLTLYTISANAYEPPEASEHETGKGSIFE